MPSRDETLRWLSDDLTTLSTKVADILKSDVHRSSSASPVVGTEGRRSSPHEDVVVAAEPVSSDSSSSGYEGREGLPSVSESQGPTDSVDAVTDAVGKLSVADEVKTEPSISASLPAAAVAADAMEGAVGGRNDASLFNLLTQFADDTVCHVSALY